MIYIYFNGIVVDVKRWKVQQPRVFLFRIIEGLLDAVADSGT